MDKQDKSKLRYGPHLTSESFIEICQHKQLTIKSTQIHVGNSKSNKEYSIDKITAQKLIDGSNKHDINLFIHTCKPINLASSNKDILEKSILKVKSEIQNGDIIGAPCIVHMGSGDRKKLVQSLIKIAPKSSSKLRFPLLIEVSAGAGNQIGSTFDDLEWIMKKVKGLDIGICLDTQHLFAAGEFDMSKSNDIIKLFDKLCNTKCDDWLINYIKLIHLNDSKTTFGSRVDRHETLGCGYIWNKNFKSLDTLLSLGLACDVDFVCETGNVLDDMQVIQNLGYL